MINAFPKIFALGTDYIRDILTGPVEITEKIDGSQFVFGKYRGELLMRSKGKQMWTDAHEKMFDEAVNYVQTIAELVPEGITLFCEYLKRPKHNVLAYKRVPQNHLTLFGSTTDGNFDANWERWADLLDIEPVSFLERSNIFPRGTMKDFMDYLNEQLKTESMLGGPVIEGLVIKNYHQPFLLGGQPIPIMMGKYVSEKFKETHQKGWKGQKSNAWDMFKEQYRTEARWQKAIQHLRDSGNLENTPQDIGKLIKEIQNDLTEECKEEIKDGLWKIFNKDLIRKAVAGFPEWYKKRLIERG